MRLLVACPNCQRCYDATGRKVGGQFRCHCGAAVKVQKPRGHEASVVRCSSCGAPREERARTCRFCTADFTLHERDLDTVCPKCLSRVSDRAKFCSHCGAGLTPESVAGEETPLPCPVCAQERRLRGRKFGDIPVLECAACGGLWLGTETFRQLADRTAKESLATASVDSPERTPADFEPDYRAADGPRRYRNCPICKTHMHRRNYASGSGVIIDSCKKHGLWFDADELPRILDWIRCGGLQERLQRKTADDQRQERARRAIPPEEFSEHVDRSILETVLRGLLGRFGPF